MRHGRYAEPRLLDKKLLQVVEGAHALFGIDRMGAERSGDLAHPRFEHLLEGLAAGSLREDILTHAMLAVRREDQPMRIHLRDLLGQRHPPEKIGDAFLYRQSRVFVGICSHGF